MILSKPNAYSYLCHLCRLKTVRLTPLTITNKYGVIQMFLYNSVVNNIKLVGIPRFNSPQIVYRLEQVTYPIKLFSVFNYYFCIYLLWFMWVLNAQHCISRTKQALKDFQPLYKVSSCEVVFESSLWIRWLEFKFCKLTLQSLKFLFI